MESIKELRQMLQEEKVHPIGWLRPWGYKLFQRGPSIYITRLLLPTRITPTHVTISGIFFGLGGSYFLLQFEWQWKLCGLFLLYLNILSDKVDGEMARYRKTYSIRGIYWDEINHLLIPPLFWLALTFGVSKITIYETRLLFVTGIVGALALIVNRVVHSLAPQIYAKKYMNRESYFALSNTHGKNSTRNTRVLPLLFIVRAVHQFQDFFILIASTTVILLLETATRYDAIFHPLLTYFVFGMSLLLSFFALENTIRKARSVESDLQSIRDRSSSRM